MGAGARIEVAQAQQPAAATSRKPNILGDAGQPETSTLRQRSVHPCSSPRKRATMTRALAALAFASLATFAQAQNPSADELARRNIERRAVEAVIWGMPAVNTDLMLQEMLTKTAGKVNQIVYWGRPLDWRNQTLTPNPDAIYLMAFFNTKDAGPIVIDVPPGDASGSLNGNIVTVWQTALETWGSSASTKALAASS
jgi:hypothetical protein